MIRNRDALLIHGQLERRRLALDVAEAGLARCDPFLAVERTVRLEGGELIVGGHAHRLHSGGRIAVLGSGKASLRIGQGLERVLGDRLDGGIIAVRDLPAGAGLERIELLEAAHPLPDRRGALAARRIIEWAAGLGEHDLVIACFTGGSSALTSLPPPGVSEADKRELHRLLLGSGMAIGDVNAVRGFVSSFKGGRLARAAMPARLINLTVSDVPGNDLETLTDPSVQGTTTVAEAIELLNRRGLWGSIPASVREYLCSDPAALPDLGGAEIHSELLVTGGDACEAMTSRARAAGAEVVVVSTELEGEATATGSMLAGEALARIEASGMRRAGPLVLVGCGGESTVSLGPEGRFGSGGPNQEAALAAAEAIAGRPVAAVLLDTDGSDGGTELAGAVVDGDSAGRARSAGLDVSAALRAHLSGAVVAALGDGVETGPTHTNVNDLFAFVAG